MLMAEEAAVLQHAPLTAAAIDALSVDWRCKYESCPRLTDGTDPHDPQHHCEYKI